ncbi:hypothetical protein FHS63_003793 [Azospirillum doebereinerae]
MIATERLLWEWELPHPGWHGQMDEVSEKQQ